MEAVIFVGLQGAGKSSFYRERFFHTHLRINLDQLRTRHRERRFMQVCVESRQRFVVDNTNPTRADRAVYIRAAKEAGFRVVGFYFQSRIEDCMRRNEQRPVPQRVPRAFSGRRAGWNSPPSGRGSMNSTTSGSTKSGVRGRGMAR